MLIKRRSLLFVGAVLTLGDAGQAGAQATGGQQDGMPPFSLTLSVVQPEVKLGQPVKLKVVVTNNSDHKIVLWKENAEDQGGFVYKITVRDSHSAVPPDTALGRLLKDREDPTRPVHFTRSGGPLDLRPGGAITDYLNVGKLYDLAPGTYVVEVMRPDQETKLNVKSNSVTVTITK